MKSTKKFNLIGFGHRAIALLGIISVSSIVINLGLFSAPVRAAACAIPATDYGSVTFSTANGNAVNIPSTGTYTVWSRMAVPDTTNTTYMLEIDGNTCYTVGGGTAIPTTPKLTQNPVPTTPATNWTWVNYQNGSTASVLKLINFPGGLHNVKMIGNAPSVAIDRVLFLSDTCVPDNIKTSTVNPGDNCTAATDTTAPTASITAPANAATVSGGAVAVSATAMDTGTGASGMQKVEFYIDPSAGPATTTPLATDTGSPYSFTWSTTSGGYPNGTYVVRIKAYDVAGNVTTASINVTVSNTTTVNPADIDGNPPVGINDLSILANNWGKGTAASPATHAMGNLDVDFVVGINDLSILAGNWGK